MLRSPALLNHLHAIFKVSGESMAPTLRHSDCVIVRETNGKEIRRNDIILFKNDPHNICHRVIGITVKQSSFIFHTKGDHADRTEEVPESRLLGKVIGLIRNGKIEDISSANKKSWRILIKAISASVFCSKLIVNNLLSSAFCRKLTRSLLPREANYVEAKNAEETALFNSYLAIPAQLAKSFTVRNRIMALLRNKPVAKLWILNNNDNEIFLYGPYVRFCYRARGIGEGLINHAISVIKTDDETNKRERIFALDTGPATRRLYEKIGFLNNSREGKTQVLHINLPRFQYPGTRDQLSNGCTMRST